MAISAHQKVSPIETATPPRTTLNTLTLPPNQKQNCCQGFPCRAAAGMWSMWRFSTYRRSCSLRSSARRIQPFVVTLPGRNLLVLSWKVRAGSAGGIWVYRPLISAAAFSAMASTVAFGWALGIDRDHRGVGDPQPGDPVDPQLRVGDRAGDPGPIRQVPAGW